MTAVNQLYVHLKPKGRDGRATHIHSLDAQHRQLWSKIHAIKVIQQGMWWGGRGVGDWAMTAGSLSSRCQLFLLLAATEFVTRAKAIRVNFACHTNHIPFATWLSLRFASFCHCHFRFRFRFLARFPMHSPLCPPAQASKTQATSCLIVSFRKWKHT